MRTPYVVAWSGEVGHIVRPDPQLSGWMALFSASGAPGQGSPVYAALSEARQRQCVLEHRCGVCGDVIPDGEASVALLITAAPSEARRVGDFTEPLTCRGCLAVPLQHCPRVREAIAKKLLHPVLIGDYNCYPQWYVLGEPDNIPSVDHAMWTANEPQCVGMLWIRAIGYDHLTVSQLHKLAEVV